MGADLLQPGDEFTYDFVVTCSGLTIGCVNQTFTDVLPEGLDVTSLPTSNSRYRVTYEASTRRLSLTFTESLQEPVGAVGLNDGSQATFSVGMRLPPETPITDGTVIGNTGTTVADNAPARDSSANVTVDVPRVVRPATTKAWSDGSAVAGTNEASTITLGVRNGSSTSAEISSLTVTDSTPATFENFDFAGGSVTSFPAGANRAQLLVCTADASACPPAAYQPGPVVTGPVLELPAGVDTDEVTGVRVVFTSAAGTDLPYDATGGSVRLGMVLRDTERSTGDPLRPAGKLTVDNCAVPSAVDDEQGSVNGPQACRTYDILPDTVNIALTKSFFPDTDGNFAANSGEYAVLGQNSPATAVVNAKNNSPFPIAEVVITEPGVAAGVEFDKFDVGSVRVRYPSGATSATMVVTYADGTSATSTPANNTQPSVDKAGTRVTGVTVTYRGVNGAGDPTIAAGATAGLDLRGTLNDQVTEADLPGGTSPGVRNCAGFTAAAGRPDGTGTATGVGCANLTVERPRTTGTGVKSTPRTSIPVGEPIPFSLRFTNNGNLPLVNPELDDPSANPAAGGPFASLRIVSATVSKDAGTPPVTIELYDPDTNAWVAYDTAPTAIRDRAIGIRARMTGNLTPTKSFTLNLVTERRDGVPDGVSIQNCFTAGAGGDFVPADPYCAPRILTGPENAAATLNKSINPSTLVRPIPGLPVQTADVTLTVRNNGNLSLRSLQATDNDTDFFDAVNFTGFGPTQFPAGADRIRIDAYVDGAWVDGTPAAGAALPAGVSATQVVGIRATFTSSRPDNDGFLITPCTATGCDGKVDLRVSPREFLRSAPTTRPSDTLQDTVQGTYVSPLQDDLPPADIPPNDATLTLTSGTPQIDVNKTPNSTVGPGEPAPFNLTVTNNGSANVPQLLVSDALPVGLAFDETFAGDGGLPFKIINTAVPADTDPVPTPAFTPVITGERVSGLRFDFGDWIFRPGATLTIQIQITLEPGVVAGQTITNTMGATSPVEDLQCTAGDPVSTDGSLGEGRFCTSSARVTVRAGAAFSARKWVRGRDSLGWYNTRTGDRVAPGSRGCPSTTDADGNLYTAYPCIALVNPGDQYHYLLRLINAGTQSATAMRIVDRLPVAGDRGVILDLDRGTDWNNRPTLASEPVLDGASPGALTNSYTNGAVCADDVSTDPTDTACPAGAWNDGFGRGNTGVQMRLAFATPLPPGGGVALRFAMDTPLDVARAADPSIAWNSFAHAETTLGAGGRPNYLPPVEPIKVGVGLQYGTLAVTKQIGENPSDLPLADLQFGFHYTCTIDPQGGSTTQVADGDLVAVPGQTVTVGGIPAGASCRVWETKTFGGVSDATEAEPKVVAIQPFVPNDDVQTSVVTVTNDFPDAVIRLRKVVTGAAATAGLQSYPVEVSCSFDGQDVAGFPKTVDVVPSEPSFQVSVPQGAACSASETDDGGATEVIYDPAGGGDGSGSVTAESGTPKDITIINDYRAGGLQITKTLVGPGSPELSKGPFTFAVSCTFDGRPEPIFTDTITLPGDDSSAEPLVSKPFPVGDDGLYTLPVNAVCTITETVNGGADSTEAPKTVTILDEVDDVQQVVPVEFTNRFSAGVLSLTKTLAGDGKDSDVAENATFAVRVTCERRDGEKTFTDLDKTVNIKGGEVIDVVGNDTTPGRLPLGTHCWAAETEDGGATSSQINFDSYDNADIVVASDDGDDPQQLELEVTNTFDVADLSITKRVDGAAASFARDFIFTVSTTCTLDQGGPAPTMLIDAEEKPIRDGETLTYADLPVGAVCDVTEPDFRGATETTITASSDAPVAVGAEGAEFEVTNTYDAATLEVSKRVVNGDPGPYDFEVSCTLDGITLELPTKDSAFSLKDGQRRRIDVPIGSECTVTEVDVPSDDDVSFTDSDGVDDGTVVLDGDASVKVTNTFGSPGDGDGDGSSSGSGSTDSLSDTGAPAGLLTAAVVGVLAIVGGAAALLARRRRD